MGDGDVKIQVKNKEELNAALDNFRVDSKETRAGLKAKLKEKVAAELRVDTNEDKLSAVIEALVNETAAPKTDDEKTKLKAEALELARKLLMIKGTEGNADAAIAAFNEGLERADGGGGGKGGTPWGAIGGAAAGVAAAATMNIGDWTSFSGIMKKLAIVGAGLGVGLMVTDDFGVRTQAVNLVTGKKPEGASK